MNLSVFFSNTYVQIGIILLVFLIVVGVFYYKKRSTISPTPGVDPGLTSGQGTTSTTASGATGQGTTSTTASGATGQGTTSTTASGATQRPTLNPDIYGFYSGNLFGTLIQIIISTNGLVTAQYLTNGQLVSINGKLILGNSPNLAYNRNLIYTYDPIAQKLLDETSRILLPKSYGTPILFTQAPITQAPITQAPITPWMVFT
jgi:hypothetical protein